VDSRRRPRSSEGPGFAPARAAEAVTLALDGGTIVYHLVTGEVHRLDQTGSIVWQFLDGQTTVEELAGDLAAAFEVAPGVVGGAVRNLLDRLGESFLLADGCTPEPRRERILTNPPSA